MTAIPMPAPFSPLLRRLLMLVGSALAIGGTGYVTTSEHLLLPAPFVIYAQSAAFYESIASDAGARPGRRIDAIKPGLDFVTVSTYCVRPGRGMKTTREFRWITITGDGLGLIMGSSTVEIRDDPKC